VIATIAEDLITTSSQLALLTKQLALGLLVHLELGRQYCGNAYRALLHRHKGLHSQNGHGECLYYTLYDCTAFR
jgi:putative transposase